MTQVSYHPHEFDYFIGIDTDKKSNSFTVKDRKNMSVSKKVCSNPEYLYNYIHKHLTKQKVLCAYEAGPTGFELYDYLTNKKIPCFVVSPLSIPKASNDKVKTNKRDSIKIAEQLKAGKLRSIQVPKGPYRELRHLVTLQQKLGQKLTATKQRIKSLLLYTALYRSIKEPLTHWSDKYINQLKNLSCSDAVKYRLNSLLEDFTYYRNKRLSAHKELLKFIKFHKQIEKNIKYLRSIPGIGFIVSTTILARIGDPGKLSNSREIAGFLGLVPSEYSTGENIHKGAITHLGNKKLRALFVEASWVAINKNTQLKQFFHRIKSRNHPKIASKKAIVAVARKMSQIVYRVLKDQRMYHN